MARNPTIVRRDFLRVGAMAAASAALAPAGVGWAAGVAKPVRIGCVGVGGRGTGLLKILLTFKGVEVPAVCDINPANATRAQSLITTSGRAKPDLYTRGEEDF